MAKALRDFPEVQAMVYYRLTEQRLSRGSQKARPELGPVTDSDFGGLTGGVSAGWKGLDDFLRAYVSSGEATVTFGGRAAQLAELDTWLAAPEHPFGLLMADAGRGKSALVSQWVTAVATQGRAAVAFVPISIRFGTSGRQAALQILFERLQWLRGLHGEGASDRLVWASEIATALRADRGGDDLPLLVIVDGADEAAGWHPERALPFPPNPGAGVKILVSARQRLSYADKTWESAFGWSGRAVTFKLPLLSLTDIVEIVRASHERLDPAAVARDLLRVTGGDPLLVSLYVDAMGPAGFLDHAELSAVAETGLRSYFDGWWANQNQQWAAEGRNPLLESDRVSTILTVLATVLGPVTRLELGALAEISSGLALDAILNDVRRWVIEVDIDGHASRGRGFVLAHPRLSDYFAGRLLPAELTKAREHVIDYCRMEHDRLRAASAPEKVSVYAVRHFGAHLATAGDEATLDLLVSPIWREAWLQLGDDAGFAEDVIRAWDCLAALDTSPDPVATGTVLSREVRYALVLSHVWHSAPRLDSLLLRHVVALGSAAWPPSWSLTQVFRDSRGVGLADVADRLTPELYVHALDLVAEIPQEQSRADALRSLAPFLDDALVQRALSIAATLTSPLAAAQALTALATTVPPVALGDVVAMARRRLPAAGRAEVIAAALPRLDHADAQRVACKEVADARFTDVLADCRAWITCLAPVLPRGCLESAQAICAQAGDPVAQVIAVLALAMHLLGEEHDHAVQQARGIAAALKDPRPRAEAFAAVAKCLAAHERHAYLMPELERLAKVAPESRRAAALSILAGVLPASLAELALAVAGSIVMAFWRSQALIALAPRTPPELVPRLLALGEDVGVMRADILINLSDAAVPKHADALLQIASDAPDPWSRVTILSGLAPRLPDRLVPLAQALAIQIDDDELRERTLLALLPRLPTAQARGHLMAMLTSARRAASRFDAAPLLRELLGMLDAEQADDAFDLTLSLDEEQRESALTLLAPKLSGRTAPRALQAVADGNVEWHRSALGLALLARLDARGRGSFVSRALADDRSEGVGRVRTLARLASAMPAPERSQLVRQALTILTGLQGTTTDRDDDDYLANALGYLVPMLTPDLAKQALDLAVALERPEERLPLRLQCVLQLRDEDRAIHVNQITSEALSIDGPAIRDRTLRALARHLTGTEIADVIQRRRVGTSGLDPDVVLDMAKNSEGDLPFLLFSYPDDPTGSRRESMYAELLVRVPHQDVESALRMVEGFAAPHARLTALEGLARRLPPDVVPVALGVVRSLQGDDALQATALSALADIPRPHWDEAWNLAVALSDNDARLRAMAALAKHGGPSAIVATRTSIARRPDWFELAAATGILAEFSDWLDDNELLEAAAAVCAVRDDATRIAAMKALGARTVRAPREQGLGVWDKCLRSAARRATAVALAEIAALSQLLTALGTGATVLDTARNVFELSVWLNA